MICGGENRRATYNGKSNADVSFFASTPLARSSRYWRFVGQCAPRGLKIKGLAFARYQSDDSRKIELDFFSSDSCTCVTCFAESSIAMDGRLFNDACDAIANVTRKWRNTRRQIPKTENNGRAPGLWRSCAIGTRDRDRKSRDAIPTLCLTGPRRRKEILRVAQPVLIECTASYPSLRYLCVETFSARRRTDILYRRSMDLNFLWVPFLARKEKSTAESRRALACAP